VDQQEKFVEALRVEIGRRIEEGQLYISRRDVERIGREARMSPVPWPSLVVTCEWNYTRSSLQRRCESPLLSVASPSSCGNVRPVTAQPSSNGPAPFEVPQQSQAKGGRGHPLDHSICPEKKLMRSRFKGFRFLSGPTPEDPSEALRRQPQASQSLS
jgi:hypothetical protein